MNMDYQNLRNTLMEYQPIILLIHILAIICFVILALRESGPQLRTSATLLVCCAIVSVFALAVIYSIVPKTHRIYFDEDIYVQIGQSTAYDGMAGMVDISIPLPNDETGRPWRGVGYQINKEPNGYPFIVSLFVALFGLSHGSGPAATLLLYVLGIFGVAFLGRAIIQTLDLGTNIEFVMGLSCAVGFAFWPELLRWSVSSATEVSAVALATWSILLAWMGLSRKSHVLLILSLLVTAYGVQLRPEGLMLFLPVLLIAGRFGGSYTADWQAKLLYASVVTALMHPHFLLMSSMSGEDWGASGPKFAAEHAVKNFSGNALYWLVGDVLHSVERPPQAVALFAIVGLIWLFPSKRFNDKPFRPTLPFTIWSAVVIWFVLFFVIFVPFYAGSYFYGADVRFSLLALPPFIIFVSAGFVLLWRSLSRLADRVSFFPSPLRSASVSAVMIGLFCWSYMPSIATVAQIGEEAWQSRADHTAVEVMSGALPDSAVVLSHSPGMWATHGVASGQVIWAFQRPDDMELLMKRYPVYYHYDYWDVGTERDIGTRFPADFVSDAQKIRNRFNYEETHSIQGVRPIWRFRLWKLSPKE